MVTVSFALELKKQNHCRKEQEQVNGEAGRIDGDNTHEPGEEQNNKKGPEHS